MERLTVPFNGRFAANTGITYWDIVDRLAAYEDAEECGELVRVVRCKDCKYCKVECGNYCCYVDDYLKMPTPHYGDFYCADGERRDNDG